MRGFALLLCVMKYVALHVLVFVVTMVVLIGSSAFVASPELIGRQPSQPSRNLVHVLSAQFGSFSRWSLQRQVQICSCFLAHTSAEFLFLVDVSQYMVLGCCDVEAHRPIKSQPIDWPISPFTGRLCDKTYRTVRTNTGNAQESKQ